MNTLDDHPLFPLKLRGHLTVVHCDAEPGRRQEMPETQEQRRALRSRLTLIPGGAAGARSTR